MAKFELSNKQEFDKDHDQYSIKVEADLGKDATDTHEQVVVLPKKGTDEAAQKYADDMEAELKEKYEADQKALADTKDAPADEADNE